jgi:hypothetical protein
MVDATRSLVEDAAPKWLHNHQHSHRRNLSFFPVSSLYSHSTSTGRGILGRHNRPDNLLANNFDSLVVTFATAGRLPVFAQDVTTNANAGRREGFRARDS